MERIRRRHGATDDRERPAPAPPPRREPTLVQALLDLQQTAGNRGVAAAIGGGALKVQRQPKGGKNDGGVLTLGGEDIPLQAATWSLKIGTQQDSVGSGRPTVLVPTNREAGNIVLTRRVDEHSKHLFELADTTFDTATLRLDRPSSEGMLPAASLDLRDVGLVAVSRSPEEEKREKVELFVGDLGVAGMGREDEIVPKSTKGEPAREGLGLRISPIDGDAWPALPIISASVDDPAEKIDAPVAGATTLKSKTVSPGPVHVTVQLVAGMALTRLSKASEKNSLMDVTVTKPGSEVTVSDAIVEKIASTTQGANVVEIAFVGERARWRRTK